MKLKLRRSPREFACEVVRIDTPLFLVDEQRCARRYQTAGQQALAPGYYLALRPTGGPGSDFGPDVRFLGPFAEAAPAHLLKLGARDLGLARVAAAGDRAPVRETRQDGQQAFGTAMAMACA